MNRYLLLLSSTVFCLSVVSTHADEKPATKQQSPVNSRSATTTLPVIKPDANSKTNLQQLPLNPNTNGLAQPVISELRLYDPNTGRRIYGQRRYQREVAVELIGTSGQPLSDETANQYRYSYDSKFTGSTWRNINDYPMRRVRADLPVQPGMHTVWVQVRKIQMPATANSLARASVARSFTLELTNATLQAEAELTRRGCNYEAVLEASVVFNIRCPLADFVASLKGLDSIKIDLEKEGSSIESRLNLAGQVEYKDVAHSLKLGAIKPVEQVHVAANGIRTQSTTVSVDGNTIRLRFQFESAQPEFILALKAPGKAPCVPCLPDLQWNNAAFTVNIPLAGNANTLTIGNISVSNLTGNWDLASGLAAASATTLTNAGINGAQDLLAQTRTTVSAVVQQRVNEVLTQKLSQLYDAMQAALRAGVGNSGNLTLGYQAYNSSIVATYKP